MENIVHVEEQYIYVPIYLYCFTFFVIEKAQRDLPKFDSRYNYSKSGPTVSHFIHQTNLKVLFQLSTSERHHQCTSSFHCWRPYAIVTCRQ